MEFKRRQIFKQGHRGTAIFGGNGNRQGARIPDSRVQGRMGIHRISRIGCQLLFKHCRCSFCDFGSIEESPVSIGEFRAVSTGGYGSDDLIPIRSEGGGGPTDRTETFFQTIGSGEIAGQFIATVLLLAGNVLRDSIEELP
ncbi:MAG: hypothetical protein ABSG56_34175, partial [Bryobacteraceae bacterium]